jgi:hypothetical protein
VIPLYNLPPHHPQWLSQQLHYLEAPDTYPQSGYCPVADVVTPTLAPSYRGILQKLENQDYRFSAVIGGQSQSCDLLTERPEIDRQLQNLQGGEKLEVRGRYNPSGPWLVAEALSTLA